VYGKGPIKKTEGWNLLVKKASRKKKELRKASWGQNSPSDKQRASISTFSAAARRAKSPKREAKGRKDPALSQSIEKAQGSSGKSGEKGNEAELEKSPVRKPKPKDGSSWSLRRGALDHWAQKKKKNKKKKGQRTQHYGVRRKTMPHEENPGSQAGWEKKMRGKT